MYNGRHNVLGFTEEELTRLIKALKHLYVDTKDNAEADEILGQQIFLQNQIKHQNQNFSTQ